MNLKKFFQFDEYMTPTIIKILYWVGLVGAALAGLSRIFFALDNDSVQELLTGVFILILAPIYTRVICEIVLVLFKISADLSALRYYREVEEAKKEEAD